MEVVVSVRADDRTRELMAGQEQGLGMFVLRAWMWSVPAALLIASIVFSVVAVLDGRWALLAAMIVMGSFAVALLVLHWWLLYRFGRVAK